MYKPGGTIAQALQRIQTNQYVLPAIQREFVWRPDQIERLFDSLMQGYPFGTFLFWKVEPATSGQFKFYDFVRDYHQRDAKHCPELPPLHQQTFSAVLDGQQRLTALNIGLRGSMAIKLPNKWWTSPDAFPKRTLRLNLLKPLNQPDEDGALYEFRFLDDVQAERTDAALWFPVSAILAMKEGHEVGEWVIEQGLPKEAAKGANQMLSRLLRVVHIEPLVHYFEEEDQRVERVLNIFIRLNSGGTVLSYSDLLLSIAVAQWTHIDARSEIHKLVDELNRIGAGFSLSQDFVLKAGLMLADVASVGFKVENFTRTNMAALESKWPQIRTALVRTVELAASFGLNGQTLRADSALLPIAYSLYQRAVPDNYVTHSSFAKDRENIRRWLFRSLVKASGIWGSGLDTLLTVLRDVLRAEGASVFPVEALATAMEARGKSLAFHAAEIEELLGLTYGERRTFPLLSMMFPFVNLRNQFHVDHVFPSARFTMAKLRRAEVPVDRIDTFQQLAQQLPNLQLLEGAANIEKQDTLPHTWLEQHFADDAARGQYRSLHLLGDVPEAILDFEKFFAARRDRMRTRLDELLRPGAPIGS